MRVPTCRASQLPQGLTPGKITWIRLADVKRSHKGTGFDYWVGDDGPRRYPFDNKARLEVSGILRETEKNSVEHRIKEKCRQTEKSDHTRFKAFVAVVEFGHPMAKVVKR